MRNAFGLVSSASALVTVIPPSPSIIQQPISRTVPVGTSVVFSVEALGAGALSYQWFRNGEPIASERNTSITLSNVGASACGLYSVLVWNGNGSTRSSNAVLALSLPSIILDNSNVEVFGVWESRTNASQAGTTHLLGMQGLGSATLRFRPVLPWTGTYRVYEWHPPGSSNSLYVPHLIVSATGATTVVVNQNSDTGRWNCLGAYPFLAGDTGYVQINDSCPDPGRFVMGDALRFDYVEAPTLITDHPQSQTAVLGSSSSFTVSAVGAQPVNYQWQKDGVNLTGATSATLMLTNVQVGDQGSYSVIAFATDGSVVSRPASLTLVGPSLSPAWANGDRALDWTGQGTLQVSTNILGPYIDIPEADVPYLLWPATEPVRFFRVRH